MKLVFDFGGVLFRWQPHEFMPRLLPHIASSEAATSALLSDFFQGYGGEWADFDRGTANEAQVAQRIARRTGMALIDVRKVIDAVPSELRLLPHAEPLLARLRAAGHGLFYLSNMPAAYAARLEQAHPLSQWFDSGVFSSRVGLVKPEPAIFHEAAKRFDAAPAELLFIDDFAHNVKAARMLGWDAIHFLSAEQCEAELAERGL